MGCNCGKKRVPPAGLARGTVIPAKVGQGRSEPSPPTQPSSGQQVSSSGQKASTGQQQTFTLITPDRRTQTFGSRLEADAARVRSGGVGTIS